MSKTLSQTANTSRTTTAPNAHLNSVSTGGGSRTQPTQIVDSTSKLIGDIGKMFGKGVKQHQQASEFAGEYVGVDNMTSYKKELAVLDEEFARNASPTSVDVSKKMNDEELIYQKYMDKGAFGENDLANEGFKKTYGRPATGLKQQRAVRNTAMKTALFTKEEKEDISDKINTLDFDINKETVKSFKARYRNVGLDANDVDAMVYTRINNGVAKYVQENANEFFDAGGNAIKGKFESYMKDAYKIFEDTNSDSLKGAIAKSGKQLDSYVEREGKKIESEYYAGASALARASTWMGKPYTDENGVTHTFVPTYAEFERTINAKYPLMSKQAHTQVMNMYKKKTGSGGGSSTSLYVDMDLDKYSQTNSAGQNFVEGQYEVTRAEAVALINSGTLTASKQATMVKKVYKIDRDQRHIIHAGNEITTISSDNVEEMKELINKGDKDAEGYPVTGSVYRVQAERQLSDIEEKITSNTMNSPEAVQEFRIMADKAKQYSTALGISQPKIFKQFDTSLKDYSGGGRSLESMKQLSEYVKYRYDNGEATMGFKMSDVRHLDQILEKKDKDGNIDVTLNRRNANTFMAKMATSTTGKSNSTVIEKEFEENIIGMGKGSEWGAIINTDMPLNTAGVLQEMYASNGGSTNSKDIAKYVNSFDTYDVGSGVFSGAKDGEGVLGTVGGAIKGAALGLYNSDRYRVMLPVGVSGGQFSSYLSKILKRTDNQYDRNDLDFVPQTDGHELSYRVVAQGRYLGTISKRGQEYLEGEE